jgi:hypothetical protein
MCPMCWVTALISLAAILAISALVVAASDKWILILAGVLGVLAVCHWGGVAVPWWSIAFPSVAIALRMTYIVSTKRETLLISKAWLRARAIAERRCSTKESASR